MGSAYELTPSICLRICVWAPPLGPRTSWQGVRVLAGSLRTQLNDVWCGSWLEASWRPGSSERSTGDSMPACQTTQHWHYPVRKQRSLKQKARHCVIALPCPTRPDPTLPYTTLLSTLYSLLSTLYSLLSTLYSLLSTHYALLSTLYTLYSPFLRCLTSQYS